ncbi:MAG: tetratricopeptide repeat protein [Propionivibrio sp.]
MIMVLALVFALLSPFVISPPFFDDHNIFLDNRVLDLAQKTFSGNTRVFPNFSIGFIHVVSAGDIGWNRRFSIVLFGFIIVALYCLVSRLAEDTGEGGRLRSSAIPPLVCLWVALSPVSVYATGYLIQRTVVFATLFGIISTTLYLRAQQESRNADVVSAALLAFLSVMSKEHAVFLPAATIALTPLVTDWNRQSIRRASAYFLLTLPGAIWAILHRGQAVLGESYEIFSGEILSQIPSASVATSSLGVWLMSMGTQLLLFWKYLFLWLVPNPAWMSVDMRVDFAAWWSSPLFFFGVAVSVTVMLGAVWVWWWSRGRGRLGVLSSILLFAAIPFAVELSTVRVQEPFVLYRSFLWMPAYALLLTVLLAWGHEWVSRFGVLAGRAYWVVATVAALSLFPLAQDRLRSFSSEEALWQDALEKLPRPNVPGADRIYYNLAGEAFKRKDYAEALRLSERVVEQNPRAFQGYLAQGTSLLALREVDAAERAFDEADKHNPPKKFLGYIESKRCAIAQVREDRDETVACLRRSAKLGYEPARFKLQMAGIPLEE